MHDMLSVYYCWDISEAWDYIRVNADVQISKPGITKFVAKVNIFQQ